jgi:hypothetical protein
MCDSLVENTKLQLQCQGGEGGWWPQNLKKYLFTSMGLISLSNIVTFA